MKNIIMGAGITALLGMTACSDNELTVIRPEAEAGTLTFELYTPENSEDLYTLLEENASSVMESLKFEKPDYGFTSVNTYSLEVSLEKEFVSEFTVSLKSIGQSEELDIITQDINSAILKLHPLNSGYPAVNETQEVFVRVKSVISSAVNSPLNQELVVKPAYSNAIAFNINAYQPENIALPATYFLIGVNGWGNDPSCIGSDLIPLSLVPGYEYDAVDGRGEFSYTGYFKGNEGFKIIGTPGSWSDQWGEVDGEYVYGAETSQNITLPASGYYTVTLNSIEETLTIEPADDIVVTTYKWIELIGDFNAWDDAGTIKLTPLANVPTVHYGDITIEDETCGIKFRADGVWGVKDWGGKDFPYSLSGTTGDNIPSEAGDYRVVFNQIDNCYFFFKK